MNILFEYLMTYSLMKCNQFMSLLDWLFYWSQITHIKFQLEGNWSLETWWQFFVHLYLIWEFFINIELLNWINILTKVEFLFLYYLLIIIYIILILVCNQLFDFKCLLLWDNWVFLLLVFYHLLIRFCKCLKYLNKNKI